MKKPLVSTNGTIQAGKDKKKRNIKARTNNIFTKCSTTYKKQYKLKRKSYTLLSKIKNYYTLYWTFDASLLNSTSNPQTNISMSFNCPKISSFCALLETWNVEQLSLEYIVFLYSVCFSIMVSMSGENSQV